MSEAPAEKRESVSGVVARFLAALEREDHVLLVLRDELYEGSWELMREDLIDRKEGRPCVFKLARRIGQDIERIDRLSAFEREQGVDLADQVDLAAELGARRQAGAADK
ncbi:MAG: hypothetical protein JXQ73_26330 [Phycisphaerae bacterium]|nr:hypothetical protein [Phycisphaerae bacterium]